MHKQKQDATIDCKSINAIFFSEAQAVETRTLAVAMVCARGHMHGDVRGCLLEGVGDGTRTLAVAMVCARGHMHGDVRGCLLEGVGDGTRTLAVASCAINFRV
jgi:hypothetical protein